MRFKNFVPVLIISIFLTMIACDTEVPVRELTDARSAIDKAQSVNAEEYSAKELDEATANLIKAHEQLLKDEKPKESVKSAGVSYDKAMEAYNNSLPPYSANALKRADEAIYEADVVNAEKLSPDFFAEAKELFVQAGEKFESKEYIEAHGLASGSYEAAVKAKNDSIDNRYKLGFRIGEVSSVMRKVEKYDYDTYAPEQYAVAKENLEKADSEYRENLLKDGFESIEIAGINADQAYILTMEGVTEERIEEAEYLLAEAEDSRSGVIADEDFAAAREALDISKRLRSEKEYEESLTYSNEAIRLGNMVIEESRRIASVKSVKESSVKDTDGDAVTASGRDDDNYHYYTVRTWEKYNDCLWRIAGEYYKNPRLWKKIYNANRDRIKNPDLIRPGWVIRIPKL